MARRISCREAIAFLLLLAAPALSEEKRDGDADPFTRSRVPRGRLLVRTTDNFRFHYRFADTELTRQAAAQAETVRAEIFREWFGDDESAYWQVKCNVHIHRTPRSYAAATGRSAPTPGYSSVTLRHGRVLSRRIDLLVDGSDLVLAVLPHEISHVILAEQFADQNPPLWADEGIAVLAENASTRSAHQKKLEQSFEQGTWFSAEQLMSLKNYPVDEQRGLFYAQSVSLVELLVAWRGARQFVAFVRSSETNGHEQELRRVYGLAGFPQLNELWSQHVQAAIAARNERRYRHEANRLESSTGSPEDAGSETVATAMVAAH